MSKIVSDPRLPTVNDEKIRPLTQRLYELFRQYAIAHNKSYMWDTEGTAPPTTGTWAISQKSKNTSPSGTGSLVIGWICVASGTPGTWVEMTGGVGRELLTSNRTYYVRTDGSNSNNGLTNTSGGAFLTLQKAADVVTSTLDIAQGVIVTIQLSDGTYTGTTTFNASTGSGSIVIQGNATTPSNVILNASTGNVLIASYRSSIEVKDLKIQSTSAFGIVAKNWSSILFYNLDFGACSLGHIYADVSSTIYANSSYSISGSAAVHVQITSSARFVCISKTVTLTGTPNFSIAFIYSSESASTAIYSNTYSGSATGSRYSALMCGTIFVNGAATTYLPGNAVGTTATGGQYA